MFEAVARLFRRNQSPAATRALEAAAGGYRWAGRSGSTDQASAFRAGAHLVAARAADFVVNNPHGARIAQVLPDNLVGTGIKPKCRAENEKLRASLHREFDIWTDRADVSELGDFFAIQSRLTRDMIVFGEGLAAFETADDGAPQLRQLHPDQLDRTKSGRISETRYAVQGVEFDANKAAPVAYHIRPGAPGDLSPVGVLGPQSSVRIPAGDIIHMFRPLVPGQVRGLSWFAPILLAGHELDQLLDALLVRAKVSALHTGFVYDPAGEGTYSGTATGDTLESGMEPGVLMVLPNGKRVEFPNLPDSGDAQALANAQLRAMAAGVGCTFEQVTGDFSQVNYSSARAAFLEFRRFCETVQHHVIVHQLCRPIWTRFMRWQVLRGNISARAFQTQSNGLQSAKWLPPRWPWVDPQKDARAAIMEIEANLRSRSEVIAERGYDAEEIDAEIAADRNRARRLRIEDDGGQNAA
ncbi:MAG: phage portal protein [Hoeflea sp. D1-CHI-28]